jgi:hypothetical protein
MLTKMYAMSGTPSAALVGLPVLAIPGPLAAAIWWLRGRETRNLSLEEGSAQETDVSWREAPATAPTATQ